MTPKKDIFADYVTARLTEPSRTSYSGDLATDATLFRLRSIRYGSPLSFGESHGSEVVFGEGSPGFDPSEECTKGGPYTNSPWCVERLQIATNEALNRTENDVREAVRANPEAKNDPMVLAWAKAFDDWKAESNIIKAQIQTAKDNSEWMEGAPDDEDESAVGPRLRIEQWLDKTLDLRNNLKDIGVKLRPPQKTPEEIKKLYGETPKSPAELAAETAKYVAVGAVAVAGIYALGLFKTAK